jgi:hypothetical protein
MVIVQPRARWQAKEVAFFFRAPVDSAERRSNYFCGGSLKNS